MIRVTARAALVLALAWSPLAAQQNPWNRQPDPSPFGDSLLAIARRGRALAEIDHAMGLAADAMASPWTSESGVRFLVGREQNGRWEIAAGSLSASADTFFVHELATPGIQPRRWAESRFDPPRPDTGYFARAARATATSIAMFHPAPGRAYAAAAVPDDAGPWWWVYIYPIPTTDGVWPRGGDVRYRVSADGRVITETRHLHESVSDYSARTASVRMAGRTDTKVEQDSLPERETPEDTDVFHVLQRRPALPELMTVGRFRYRIDVDGTIRLLGNLE